jgi:hypothetical protein
MADVYVPPVKQAGQLNVTRITEAMCGGLLGSKISTGRYGMAHQPGTEAPQTGIYWCSVCKLPVQFKAGEKLPTCKNLCGRGKWEFVRAEK